MIPLDEIDADYEDLRYGVVDVRVIKGEAKVMVISLKSGELLAEAELSDMIVFDINMEDYTHPEDIANAEAQRRSWLEWIAAIDARLRSLTAAG